MYQVWDWIFFKFTENHWLGLAKRKKWFFHFKIWQNQANPLKYVCDLAGYMLVVITLDL